MTSMYVKGIRVSIFMSMLTFGYLFAGSTEGRVLNHAVQIDEGPIDESRVANKPESEPEFIQIDEGPIDEATIRRPEESGYDHIQIDEGPIDESTLRDLETDEVVLSVDDLDGGRYMLVPVNRSGTTAGKVVYQSYVLIHLDDRDYVTSRCSVVGSLAARADLLVDGQGNAFLVQPFQGTISVAVHDLNTYGGIDVVIAKFARDKGLAWVRQAATIGHDHILEASFDDDGLSLRMEVQADAVLQRGVKPIAVLSGIFRLHFNDSGRLDYFETEQE